MTLPWFEREQQKARAFPEQTLLSCHLRRNTESGEDGRRTNSEVFEVTFHTQQTANVYFCYVEAAMVGPKDH